MPARLHAIHTTRGLAAVAVLVWHYQHFYDGLSLKREQQPLFALLRPLYEHGHRAVPLFWCLSGVVLMHVYGSQRINVRQFWLARMARLYPLHVVTLVAVAILQVTSGWLAGRTRIYGNNDLPHALLNLGLVQSWGLERGFSFNGPSWSVSVELLAYIAFAVAMKTRIASSAAGILALTLLVVPPIDAETSRWILQCIGLFFIGVLLETSVTRRSLRCSMSIVGVCALSTIVGTPRRTHLVIVTALVAGARLLDTRKWGGTAAGRLLGDASYGIFMWHVPLQMAVLIIYEALGIQRSIVDSSAHFVAYIAAAIAAGWASHRYFEEPVRRWIVRRGGSRAR